MNRRSKCILLYFVGFFICHTISFGQKQSIVQVKKENNYFFFYLLDSEKDTLVHEKSSLFKIILPDSSSSYINIDVKNGRFFKSDKPELYSLKYIPGIKYKQQIIQDSLITLVNGVCKSEANIIEIEIFNTISKQKMIQKKYFVRTDD
jgi:hypothetical protein